MNTKEYVYLRTKNVFLNEDDNLELFVFAALNIIDQTRNSNGKEKHIKNVVAKVMEYSISDAPRALVDMDNVDVRAVIDIETFEALKVQAEQDSLAFYTFDPSML